MKNRLDQMVTVIGFCAVLGIMSALFFLVPKSDFSETEKRYLAETPELTWETLSSGQFGSEIETYMADHLPGRDFFVGLNAYFEKVTGRQIAKDIYAAEDARLVEAPVEWNPMQAQQNIGAIKLFAETVGQPVDMMIVPSAGWAVQDKITGIADPYEDEKLIQDLYALAGDAVNTVDMVSVYQNLDKDSLYYHTDHHWTSLGAYYAYQTYMQQLDREFKPQEAFTVESVEGFYGTTYSRSALWLTPAEQLELWHGSEGLIVTNGETQGEHQGVFYRERLEEVDKYTVYLDGNHSVVTIRNPEAAGKGKLLVIRDSYSNCLGCFLAESYESVTLVDLRYYKGAVSELCQQENFDNVLVCYSLSNFMTDTNLIWLR